MEVSGNGIPYWFTDISSLGGGFDGGFRQRNSLLVYWNLSLGAAFMEVCWGGIPYWFTGIFNLSGGFDGSLYGLPYYFTGNFKLVGGFHGNLYERNSILIYWNL